MGSAYMTSLWGMDSPRIGVLSVGEESIKGTKLVLEAAELLSRSGLPFMGNVEGCDLVGGACDVIVTDGFTGNVVLKSAEGAAEFLFGRLKEVARSSVRARLGGLALRPALRQVYATVDAGAVGGTPLLGVAGASIVGHGRFGPRAVANGINVAVSAAAADLTGTTDRLLAEVNASLRLETAPVASAGVEAVPAQPESPPRPGLIERMGA
jgi:glycerol-3-phosphate acyltransferase PlsX